MDIGIIGAGAVARAVARRALALGHGVAFAGRHGPEALAGIVAELGPGARGLPLREAAALPVVLLAVPWTEVERALADCPSWDGRILIDATNPFVAVSPKLVLDDLGGRSASVLVAGNAPGARVVKAFNSVTMANFEKGPTRDGARRALFVSGDDADAKNVVRGLIEAFGYAAIDLGGLEDGGRMQQAGGPLAGKDLLVAP